MPQPGVIRDALLGPLLPGSSKFRYIFTARSHGVSLRHLRSDSRQGLHDVAEIHPASDEAVAAAPLLPGITLYGGPYNNHFGHMLADGMHRLWAATAVHALKGARVVFQLREGHEMAFEPWLDDLLALYGIGLDQVLLLNAPTRFEELWVPAQGRVLGGAMPDDAYLDLFPIRRLVPEPNPSEILYVSRRQHMFTGTYLGEGMVETLLARAGCEIIYPETLPIRTMMRKLVGARKIIFCEGSAIHHLELTGRLAADVFVIGRRAGTEWRFRDLLDQLSAGWTVFPHGHALKGLDWNKRAEAAMPSRACSFTDLPRLVEALAAFTGLPLAVPEEANARRAEALDLFRMLMDPRSGESASDERFGRLVREMRADPAVRRLLPPVRRSRARSRGTDGTLDEATDRVE